MAFEAFIFWCFQAFFFALSSSELWGIKEWRTDDDNDKDGNPQVILSVSFKRNHHHYSNPI